MSDKPTEAQVKEFWEVYGFHEEYFDDEPETVWAQFYPDGSMATEGYPPIDLSNLFKYAVPEDCSVSFNRKPGSIVCMLTTPNPKGVYGSRIFIGKADTDADALFWARWQAIHER